MSWLKIFDENKPEAQVEFLQDADKISQRLHEVGVCFERWPVDKAIANTASPAELLNAYQEKIDQSKKEKKFIAVDVFRLNSFTPDPDQERGKLLEEHINPKSGLCFFVAGTGIFYLHTDKKVYVVYCQSGDVISLPAGMPHWFDMGPTPHFTCLRFFNSPHGWETYYTESDIANTFPKYETLVAP